MAGDSSMTVPAPRPEIRLGAEQREALLRRSFIFKQLAPDLLSRLAQLTRVRRLERGALLFEEGEEGDALYAVVDGLIRISIAGRGDKELTLSLMEPGDVFGEIAMLDGLPRTATARAAEDCLLLVIDRASFVTLIDQEPRLARHLIELLCERLRVSTTRLAELAFVDLRARLARQLEALAISHGRHEPAGVRIALKMSQSELAQMLGVSREAVNKQLKAWSADGLLRLDRGYITITDMRRLTAREERQGA